MAVFTSLNSNFLVLFEPIYWGKSLSRCPLATAPVAGFPTDGAALDGTAYGRIIEQSLTETQQWNLMQTVEYRRAR